MPCMLIIDRNSYGVIVRKHIYSQLMDSIVVEKKLPPITANWTVNIEYVHIYDIKIQIYS